jgi:hypothetical protein
MIITTGDDGVIRAWAIESLLAVEGERAVLPAVQSKAEEPTTTTT